MLPIAGSNPRDTGGSTCFRRIFSFARGTTPNPTAVYFNAELDGSNGIDKVCRGAGGTNSDSYFELSEAGGASVYDCMHMCSHVDRGICSGIEYIKKFKRCELWYHPIGATEPYGGSGCFTKSAFTALPTPAPYCEHIGHTGDGYECLDGRRNPALRR